MKKGQVIDLFESNRGSSRSRLKIAAVSLIALTAAIASAHATDTTIDADLGDSYSDIYGNNAGGTDYGTESGSPSDNSLTFNTGAKVTITGDFSIYGGEYIDPTPANGNTVTINALDVTLTGAYGDIVVYGGNTQNSDAEGNTIAIKSGTFNSYSGHIHGGYSILYATDKTVKLKDNAIEITEGTFNGKYVTIEGAHGENYGANSTLSITGNSVTIAGGSIPMAADGWTAIRGGYAEIRISDAGATLENNTVKITGGTFATATATGSTMEIAGGSSYANASGAKGGDVKNNTVEITGDTTTFTRPTYIYGGYVNSSNGATPGTVTGNIVKINGGTFEGKTYIYGGYEYSALTGPGSTAGTAMGNIVEIGGGTFANGTTIAGGCSDSQGAGGEVEGNKVYLSGGEFNADAKNIVIGGMSENEEAVKNNTVYVYNTVDLANVELFAATNGSAYLVGSGGGNALVFGYDGKPWTSPTGSIKSVKGFDTVKITAATWNKPIIVTYFSTTPAKNGKTEIDATKVAFAGVDSVKKGDKTVLLKALEVEGEVELKSKSSKYTIGTTLQGNGTVELTEGEEYDAEITYTIDSAEPGPGPKPTPGPTAQAQTHTATMGMTAGVAALNQGTDTVLATLKNLSNSGHTGLEAFGAMGGGTARQETGSHVTLNAFNLATGLGSNIDVGAGTFTVGGALEAGYGSFKNHFFAGDVDPFVKKSGHLSYYGGAATAGMKWNSLWHTDGLFRLGYAKSEQGSGLYNPGLGASYDVDIGSYYVGTEVGGGKAFKLNDTNAIDVYARYFWLHKGGDDFTAGGVYDLKAVDSHRLRTGARYDLSLGSKWGFYAGLAYEYEFDGKSRLFVDGVEAEAAKTKGGRAFGELGVKLTPEKDAAGLALDLNVKGAAGSKYRDVLFGIDVKYMF